MQTKPFIPLHRVLSGRPPSRQRRLRIALAAVAACIAVAAAPTAAGADPASFFWVNKVEGTIGGSALDGSGVNQRLVDLGYFEPTQLASHGDYVYWLDRSLNAIGRAKADGSSVDRRFISGLATSEAVRVSGIAADSSGIYWTTWQGTANGGRIARANVDGSGRNDTFVTGLSSPAEDVATDATHVFWLWEDDDATRPVIGRTSKSGTNTSEAFVLGATGTESWRGPTGLATHGGFVYWTDGANGSIGRAQADGTGVQTGFITGLAAAGNSDRLLGDLVVTDSFIFWQEERSNDNEGYYGRIGRATLAGASANSNFVKLRSGPTGLAASGTGLVWSRYQHSGLARSAIDGGSINEDFVAGNSAGTPDALAADGQYLYWLDGLGARLIARAKRDGTNVTRSFVDVGPYELYDLALDATYIYFTFQSHAYLESGSGPVGIGRIRRDGSGSTEILIGNQFASDVKVTASHIYWTGHQSGTGAVTIGRASIDGTAVTPNFITGFLPGITDDLSGLALSTTHVFWADRWNRRIGRAKLDGTGPTQTFIDNVGESDSLAIDGSRLFWNGGTSDNTAGSINPGAVQVATVDGLALPSPFVEVFNPAGAFRTDPIGDIAVAQTDLATPVPPAPTPPVPVGPAETPAPGGQDPSPLPPTPPAGSSTPSPGPVALAPPTKSKPSAALRARSAKRGSTVLLSLTGVTKGTKLTVTWKPKRGRVTRATYPVRGTSLKIKVPKKAGRYTLSVKSGTTVILTAPVTAR